MISAKHEFSNHHGCLLSLLVLGEFVLYGGRGIDVSNFQRQWGSYEACLHPAEVPALCLTKQ